jgi:hypothetical protein
MEALIMALTLAALAGNTVAVAEVACPPALDFPVRHLLGEGGAGGGGISFE